MCKIGQNTFRILANFSCITETKDQFTRRKHPRPPAHLKVAARQPRHQLVDQQPQILALNRVVHVAQVRHQVVGQLRLHAHIGLAHQQSVAVEIGGLRVVRHGGDGLGVCVSLNIHTKSTYTMRVPMMTMMCVFVYKSF